MDGKNIKRIDMTKEKLLEKAREFEKKNKSFTWKPIDFPEDMTEESTLDELVSEGDNMYDALKEAVELISDLAGELEYKIAVED
jgi:hypothetical protein